jgi:pimeloyl-ACP methyl ester carboxylesterase
MPSLRVFRPSGRSGAILCAAALLAWPTLAGADLITREQLENGMTLTRAQCAALPEAVWVRAFGEDFCIRYYVSTAGGEGRKPVVFLAGDKNPKKMEKPLDTRHLANFASRLSKSAKTTGIYLARPGFDGSSGHHRYRWSVLELHAMNAALDAIKQRHRFDGVHLVGQSGGAMVIGGLLGLRRDIGCAVPGSGVLARTGKPRPNVHPKDRLVNSADGIDWIVRNSKARILVVTDPEDKTVPPRSQTTFVQQLRKAGGKVEQYFIEATDDRHHGATPYSMRAVAACVRGASPTEISAELAELRARMLASKLKREEAGKKAAEREPSKQPPGRAPRLQGT